MVYDEPFWFKKGYNGQTGCVTGPVIWSYDNSPPDKELGAINAFVRVGELPSDHDADRLPHRPGRFGEFRLGEVLGRPSTEGERLGSLATLLTLGAGGAAAPPNLSLCTSQQLACLRQRYLTSHTADACSHALNALMDRFTLGWGATR